MDELPELRSDQDVDILLSRLRARIAPPAPSPTPGVVATSGSSPAWNDFVTAQREAAATMLRALRVLADAVDELAADTPVATPVAAAAAPVRSASPRRTPSRKTKPLRTASPTTAARRKTR